MKPLSYILMVTLALATSGQAVVHGNRNGYRYNGPAHKYLPAEGAANADGIATSGHWQPQEVEERERDQQQSGYLGNQVNRPGQWQQQQDGQQGGQQEASLGHQNQQGYRQEQHRVPSYGQHEQSLQEVEYVIQQQRPQGFSQYQGNRQGQQQQVGSHQQHQSENHWDSSYNQQQQGSRQQQSSHQQQQHQSENPWDSLYNQQQQGSRQQLGSHQQQQHQSGNLWDSAYNHQQQGSRQQQPENPWESSNDYQQQESNLHTQGSNHQNEGSHRQQTENNWSSSNGHQQQQGYQHGANEQQESHQLQGNPWSSSINQHNSQGSRWQNQPSFSPSSLESLDSLPSAHAHANSKKTLARPSNHINLIPGYTLSSNPEHERFIGLDADDNRLLTQSLPFQSPSSPFRPTNNYQQQRPSSIGNGHSNFLQMQSQSYELPPTQHTQRGWVASAQTDSHPHQPNRQFQPPYY